MNPPPAAPSPVLDLAAAAALLGVAPRTFRRHCPVQPLRLGRRVVWSRAAIDRWLDAEPAPSQPAATLADRADRWTKTPPR